MNQVHWLNYVKIYCLKFTGYWHEIIKNTASYNQDDSEFRIINKFKQWFYFGLSFNIVMDSIIFFHCKKWIIHWLKKFFKNIHALYSYNPSSSADIFKFMFQGFWTIRQYFVFEAVVFETPLILVIRFRTRCSPQEATTARFKLLDVLWVHAPITYGSYLQLLLPYHSLVPYSQKYLCQWLCIMTDHSTHKNILKRIQILPYCCFLCLQT